MTVFDCNPKESTLNIFTGYFLVVGTIISYVPQLFTIIYQRSSKGLSSYSLNFVNIYCSSVMLNGLILQWDTILCCSKVTIWDCNVLLLSLDVIFWNWLLNIPIYLLMLIYFDPEGMSNPKREYKIAWILFGSFVVGLLLICGVAAILSWHYGYQSRIVTSFAFGFGIIANLTTLVQWTPQLYYTYKLKECWIT